MTKAIFGNVNGNFEYVVQVSPIRITSRLLMNMSGGDIVVNVSITLEDTEAGIIPKDYSIATGEGMESDTPITVAPRSIIRITSTGSLDFYFSTESIKDNG